MLKFKGNDRFDVSKNDNQIFQLLEFKTKYDIMSTRITKSISTYSCDYYTHNINEIYLQIWTEISYRRVWKVNSCI